jgi:hypothetical protein
MIKYLIDYYVIKRREKNFVVNQSASKDIFQQQIIAIASQQEQSFSNLANR